MKRIISLILVVVLCLALSVSAFAAGSNQGDGCGCCPDCDGFCTGDCCDACEVGAGNSGSGNKPGSSPKTGSVALAALAITACTAGGISVLASRKAK